MSETESTNVLRQLADELKLQAWLAKAEFSHPSLKHDETRNEVSALVRARDELRVQMHLGRLEAADEWSRLEGRWLNLKNLAVRTADDLGESMHDVLHDIRESYKKLSDN